MSNYKQTQEYLATYRGINVKRGQHVKYCGKDGVITDLRDGNVYVRLNGKRNSICCHPTWNMEYDDAPPRHDAREVTP